MAYIRKRTTKTGAVSTALVEAYRDKKGRPRQRILPNLHGEPTALRALARLECQRTDLQEHMQKERAEAQKGGYGKRLVAAFFAELATELAVIESKIALLKKHCTASADEIQTAIEEYKRALHDAEAITLGSLMYLWKHQDAHKAAKAALRRLRR